MITAVAKKLFGTKHERDIRKLQPVVDQINALEPGIRVLSDRSLREKTDEFRARLAKESDPARQKAMLELILPEAFAVCREASRRTLGMRHFDVQLIGGMVLHQGKIAEMRTGEGKTLVATLPVYLNALLGRGVHLVTVNDYLARRDAEWMGQIYRFLGLTVGVIVHEKNDEERKEAYNCDVTYGQNNEFGFDYLRDNMKFRLEDYVQRNLFYAIVDEVDSILVDEARTPLIISGPTEESTDKYVSVNRIIPLLKKERDFTVDEKAKTVILTEEGMPNIEKALGVTNLYDPEQMETLHHVNQALRAHHLYQLDVDYMLKDGEVVIVDEFTGRLMPGRRWSDGLHQAIEAKEGVKIQNENQTLASITFQNYFRMFEKLAGMTGTADTEAEEFHKIYNLDVVVIPTDKPMIRSDHPDIIFRTEKEKFEAIVEEIKKLHEKKQPALVGTISIEKSERLSKYLKRSGIPHNVLNAKHHEREAEIVKDAGQPAQVTIATNMAGRGTDIVLGPGVAQNGGLFIVGTERHEARRIDNQLRGRSGRQGDPGESRFYLSFEDDLMRIFGTDRMKGMMEKLGMEEGEAIEHSWTTKAIESAQRRVEGHNFDIRKHLLKYDDVMNQQRKIIYALRKEILGKEDIRDVIRQDIQEVAEEMIVAFTHDGKSPEDWEWKGIEENLRKVFGIKMTVDAATLSPRTQEGLRDALLAAIKARHEEREREFGAEFARLLEREIKLRMIDTFWKDHLLNMDHLKEGVGFEGYAQKDPLVVYRKKGFELFSEMIYSTKEATLERLFHVQLAQREPQEALKIFRPRRQQQISLSHPEAAGTAAVAQAQENPQAQKQVAVAGTIRRQGEKVGRNDPCPCGSGKKYKKCHGN
ncbi:MAG TPA: preprotein translocase subunit SecA [Bdellovibrionota bacterium]|nr:preprotein translocase subunit SecA [Bdellovibrionota bacterium]